MPEILLILKKVILLPSFSNINQMIRNLPALNQIVRQVLSRPDIHSFIHLPAVGTYNFRIPRFSCQMSSQGCLSRCRRAQYSDNISFHTYLCLNHTFICAIPFFLNNGVPA